MSDQPPPVQQLGQAVLLQGQGVTDFANLCLAGLRYIEKVDGWTAPAELRAQVDVLLRTRDEIRSCARLSGRGHVLANSSAVPAQSGATGGTTSAEEIGAADAARLMGYRDPRSVRRLAADLGGRKVGDTWIFDRSTVQAAAGVRAKVRQT